MNKEDLLEDIIRILRKVKDDPDKLEKIHQFLLEMVLYQEFNYVNYTKPYKFVAISNIYTPQ